MIPNDLFPYSHAKTHPTSQPPDQSSSAADIFPYHAGSLPPHVMNTPSQYPMRHIPSDRSLYPSEWSGSSQLLDSSCYLPPKTVANSTTISIGSPPSGHKRSYAPPSIDQNQLPLEKRQALEPIQNSTPLVTASPNPSISDSQRSATYASPFTPCKSRSANYGPPSAGIPEEYTTMTDRNTFTNSPQLCRNYPNTHPAPYYAQHKDVTHHPASGNFNLEESDGAFSPQTSINMDFGDFSSASRMINTPETAGQQDYVDIYSSPSVFSPDHHFVDDVSKGNLYMSSRQSTSTSQSEQPSGVHVSPSHMCAGDEYKTSSLPDAFDSNNVYNDGDNFIPSSTLEKVKEEDYLNDVDTTNFNRNESSSNLNAGVQEKGQDLGNARSSPLKFSVEQVRNHGVSPTQSPYRVSSQTNKKNSHNIVEKKYRSNLNDKINELRNAIPSLQSLSSKIGSRSEDGKTVSFNTSIRKLNKATVLSKATEYIRHLRSENTRLVEENQHLQNRLSEYMMAVQQSLSAPSQSNPLHDSNKYSQQGTMNSGIPNGQPVSVVNNQSLPRYAYAPTPHPPKVPDVSSAGNSTHNDTLGLVDNNAYAFHRDGMSNVPESSIPAHDLRRAQSQNFNESHSNGTFRSVGRNMLGGLAGLETMHLMVNPEHSGNPNSFSLFTVPILPSIFMTLRIFFILSACLCFVLHYVYNSKMNSGKGLTLVYRRLRMEILFLSFLFFSSSYRDWCNYYRLRKNMFESLDLESGVLQKSQVGDI
ncbi:membrane-tethered transcription factor [Schizosaccharomyces octosporus yFS286]|uniref:Membrane-tethered transcription factor n=1 Tax=Schizosaccharomyces octosporus (strain yFS286) TaxID=483514 RepID=S9PUA9_SCHOY|nr:membrane-tethered transcription factor [Schizosaccharomyces octosporus yFS286]EPX71542.1 membrane-tethered transcription factor [Schizosaccharomyces octosporus yFS286]